MNAWYITAIALLVCVVPCAIVCSRGDDPFKRLVGLEMANAVSVMILIALAGAIDRDFLYDLALAQAFLSLAAGLVFVRFMERWL
jgi:multisubunit Na+/H+ antiporter MnhF subunit